MTLTAELVVKFACALVATYGRAHKDIKWQHGLSESTLDSPSLVLQNKLICQCAVQVPLQERRVCISSPFTESQPGEPDLLVGLRSWSKQLQIH